MERWRAALRRLGPDAGSVTWRYGAFELDPSVPSWGVDRDSYMAGRYDPAAIKAMGERLAQIARREGLTMADPAAQTVRPNTFAAHRLMAAAVQSGVQVQQALGDALFAACWSRAEDVGDREVLLEAAHAAGMDVEEAAAVLAGAAFTDEVRAQERDAALRGIHAVPTFVFADHLVVSGAQDPEFLAQAARQALALPQP